MLLMLFIYLFFIIWTLLGLGKSKEVENETKTTKTDENQRVGLRSVSVSSITLFSSYKGSLRYHKVNKEIKTNTHSIRVVDKVKPLSTS